MKEYQIIFLETVISCVDWYPETMLSYGVGLKEEKKKKKKRQMWRGWQPGDAECINFVEKQCEHQGQFQKRF